MGKRKARNAFGIRLLSTSLALAILLAAGGTAYAVSAYLNDFVAAYPAANGSRIDVCILCHNQASGGSRNAYGSNFANAAIGNHTFNATLGAANSDGTGGTNNAEIAALTFPGDANDPLPAAPTITTTSPLTAGTVGTAYNQTFAATGGTPPYSWSVTVGTPPAGLTLSAAGVLSGTPTTAGTSNFTVQVTGGGTATNAFALTINPAGAPDNTAPTVSSTSPDNNATGVAVGTAVTGTFNEPIAPATLTAASFRLNDGVDNVTGTVSLNAAGTIATFTPSAPLADNTTYTATLTTAITDVAGNALAANHVWTFTTAAAVAFVVTTSDDDGWFGCAISPSGGGNGGILGTCGPLILLALGIAFRRRVPRRKE
ncbi:MAG: Ig-like domain-containing protein [Deltaproteobacteria bacterium]|nr:Ig-like domain-containing protein [Candidatus Deferrimicrobium borealis]